MGWKILDLVKTCCTRISICLKLCCCCFYGCAEVLYLYTFMQEFSLKDNYLVMFFMRQAKQFVFLSNWSPAFSVWLNSEGFVVIFSEKRTIMFTCVTFTPNIQEIITCLRHLCKIVDTEINYVVWCTFICPSTLLMTTIFSRWQICFMEHLSFFW